MIYIKSYYTYLGPKLNFIIIMCGRRDIKLLICNCWIFSLQEAVFLVWKGQVCLENQCKKKDLPSKKIYI